MIRSDTKSIFINQAAKCIRDNNMTHAKTIIIGLSNSGLECMESECVSCPIVKEFEVKGEDKNCSYFLE